MAKQPEILTESTLLEQQKRGPQGPRFGRQRGHSLQGEKSPQKIESTLISPDSAFAGLMAQQRFDLLQQCLQDLESQLVGSFELISGTSNRQLAEKIAGILKKKLNAQGTVGRFSDGEEKVALATEPKIAGNHIFIIQAVSPPEVAHHFMELCTLIDAIKRASANKITVVVPYYGYARQDRKDNPKVPITASMTAKILQMVGADGILTLDLHAEQTQGAFDGPWDNLYASKVVIPELLKLIDPARTVIVAPDMGRAKRSRKWKDIIGAAGVAIIDKNRDANGVEAMSMTGEVAGYDVVISDDMIASGGTIVEAARFCKQAGARKIYIAATHGLFIGDALTRLNGKWTDGSDLIEAVLVTDTIAHRPEVLADSKIQVISVAELIAEAIWRIHTGKEMVDLID